jgi:hypothetical protein
MGHRTVVWGAGARCVSFLNILGERTQISYVVDINPKKQGKCIPGTGQRIVGPVFLQEYAPDVVIVMNPVYKNEIEQMIQDMGIRTSVVVA